jgi:hypothetical protein
LVRRFVVVIVFIVIAILLFLVVLFPVVVIVVVIWSWSWSWLSHHRRCFIISSPYPARLAAAVGCDVGGIGGHG